MDTPASAARSELPKKKGRRQNVSASSKKVVNRTLMIKKCLDLRLQGMTLRRIAEELKISPQTAHNHIMAGIAEIPRESGDLLRQQIVDRENALIEKHWATRADPDSAKIIHASHRNLMALLGLEAPKQVVQVEQDLSDKTPAEAAAIMRNLFATGVGPSDVEEPSAQSVDQHH